jgi:hypothetical protein
LEGAETRERTVQHMQEASRSLREASHVAERAADETYQGVHTHLATDDLQWAGVA